MHSARISTIGYLVFQISICHQSHAASLNFPRSTVSSHPTALKFPSPSHHPISAVDHKDVAPSSQAPQDIKPRSVEKETKKHKTRSSCSSRKSKKYRVRAKLHQVLETVDEPKNSAGAASVHATSAQATPSVGSTTVPAPSGDYTPAPAPPAYPTPGHAPSGGEKSGDATYYGTGLGACGIVSNDGSMIAAASHSLFDSFPGATANPNLNPICGRKVKATYEGKSVQVQIVDRCTGCAMHDLDFSPAAFAQLGDMDKGRLHNMKWEWM